MHRFDCSSNDSGQRVAYTDSECTTVASADDYDNVADHAYFNHSFRDLF